MPPDDNIASLAAARRRKDNGAGGSGAGPSGQLVLDPNSPHTIASVFRQARHVDGGGTPLLLHQEGVYYRWSRTHYAASEEAAIRSELYEFLNAAWRPAKGGIEPFEPSRMKINDVLDALRAICHLPAETPTPAWLRDVPPDLATGDIIACANGLLHIPTETLLPHSPDLYTFNAIDVDFEASARCPRWQKFLDEVFPGDPKAVDQLQKMFGYLLTADTRQQKGFVLIGPKRSGKGTVARVLTGLIGARNKCAPMLSSLAARFGAEPLLGKRVAIISDARLSKRTDQQPIIELMLSVTGEDDLTIDRKFLPSVTGRLPLRFVILTNELPAFLDHGGAFVSRWIIFTLTCSFYGREDPELTDRLLEERSGILNWALAGLARLREAGRFKQPASAAAVVQRWEDLSSPIAAFLLARHRDPREILLEIAAANVADLAALLGCTVLEAAQEKRLAAIAVLPYLVSKQLIAVDLRKQSVVHLTIQDGAVAVGEHDDAMTFSVPVVEAHYVELLPEPETPDDDPHGGA
ncbi:MAG: DNA primase family protein [Stellaceae bacterium]